MDSEKGMDLEKLIKESGKKTEAKGLPDENKRQEIKNEAEIREEERRLQIFSETIGDAEYYIGGGMGIEIEEGAIKHKHSDIDIIVFEDELDKIKKNFEAKGFVITRSGGFGGHDLDIMNFETEEEGEETQNKEVLHVGVFVYKRNIEKGLAQQIESDGSINNEFPLSYFNKEKQTVEYKGVKYTVADLRRMVGFKMVSEREKDKKDIERVKPLLKSKFSEREIGELKNICKNNLRLRSVAGLNHMFGELLRKGQELTGENIYNIFVEDVEKGKKGEMDKRYVEAVGKFMEKIKDFSVSDKENAKKEFSGFVEKNIGIISEIQNKIVDETLE